MGLRLCGSGCVVCLCLLFCALPRSVQMWEAVKASACSVEWVCGTRPAVPVGCKRHLCSYPCLSSARRRFGCQLMPLVSRIIQLCRPGLLLRPSIVRFPAVIAAAFLCTARFVLSAVRSPLTMETRVCLVRMHGMRLRPYLALCFAWHLAHCFDHTPPSTLRCM